MTPFTTVERRRILAGVIAAMAIVNLVYGITFPLFAIAMDAQGASKTLIGLQTVTQAAAVPAISPFIPALLRRYRALGIMQVVALTLAALFLVAGAWRNPWFWFPLRFVMGVLTATIWAASEAVINEAAPDHWRGRIIGLYSAVGAAGFALGPLLLVATGSEGMLPFATTGLVTLIAALPLFRAGELRLDHGPGKAHGLWQVFLLAPAVMLANVVYAATIESIITFFTLFGREFGLIEARSLGLLSVMAIGNMVLALPLSWMADHVNRRLLLLVFVLLTMAGLAAMPAMVATENLAFVFAFVFGGVSGMIYALGMVLIGMQFRGSALAAATTLYTACWGMGAIIGPLVVGAGMDRFGAQYMGTIILVLFGLYLPCLLWYWLRTPGPRFARPSQVQEGSSRS